MQGSPATHKEEREKLSLNKEEEEEFSYH